MAHEAELQAVGTGCWAWIQRDGSWGWSNAGLITDGEASLLVDTLYDVALTRRMLAAFADATPAAAHIDALVNTHANGDHCYGNQLVGDVPILASEATARELADVPPEAMARLVRTCRLLAALPWPVSRLPAPGGATVGELATFFVDCFGDFAFGDVRLTPPTTTFTGRLDWQVGDKRVELLELGPAHTDGDVVAWVPSDRVVYTGDLLFSSGHPIVWAGPLSRWRAACDRLLALEPEVVVPGHGPVATVAEVVRCRDYLAWVEREATARFHAGVSELDAARDLSLEAWADWGEAERLVVNVANVYRELRGDAAPPPPTRLFGMMAALRRSLR